MMAYTILRKEFQGNLPTIWPWWMIPGDLRGEWKTKYFQWKDHFLIPPKKLFSEVPVYPVLGNHEKKFDIFILNTLVCQKTEHLPMRTLVFKDYGNTRIIGLNSMDGYNNSKDAIQSALQKLFDERPRMKEGGFCFCSKLHHPHKNRKPLDCRAGRGFYRKVVALLEALPPRQGSRAFTFSDITHGYQRAEQSKDHKHLCDQCSFCRRRSHD